MTKQTFWLGIFLLIFHYAAEAFHYATGARNRKIPSLWEVAHIPLNSFQGEKLQKLAFEGIQESLKRDPNVILPIEVPQMLMLGPTTLPTTNSQSKAEVVTTTALKSRLAKLNAESVKLKERLKKLDADLDEISQAEWALEERPHKQVKLSNDAY